MRGKRYVRSPGRGAAAGLAALLIFCLAAAPAAADEDAEPTAPRASTPAPVVSLEKLFELPSGFEPQKAERKGGVGEAAWRQRFRDARQELAEKQAALDRSKAELAQVAESSDAWAVAPPVPGVTPGMNTDAPLNYQLRQQMNREKDELADAKRQLLDLEVEANLASVPEDWRTE